MSTKTERMYVIEREGLYYHGRGKPTSDLNKADRFTVHGQNIAREIGDRWMPGSRVLPVNVSGGTITLIGETK